MAAAHRRNSDDHDDSDGRTPSLPETELRRAREEEAEDDGGRHSGSQSLPEAGRREREAEVKED